MLLITRKPWGGVEPESLFGTIYLVAPRIEALGFQMPEVDKWRKEDMDDMKSYVQGARDGLRERLGIEINGQSIHEAGEITAKRQFEKERTRSVERR